MKKERNTSMTVLLRKVILESNESFRAIEAATQIKRQSIMKFVRGAQSLRLDKADNLAVYFGIECRQKQRKGR